MKAQYPAAEGISCLEWLALLGLLVLAAGVLAALAWLLVALLRRVLQLQL